MTEYPAHEKFVKFAIPSGIVMYANKDIIVSADLLSEYQALKAKADLLDMMASALEFYAKAYKVNVLYSNYPESRSYDEYDDNGKVAQKALAEYNKLKGE